MIVFYEKSNCKITVWYIYIHTDSHIPMCAHKIYYTFQHRFTKIL